MAGADFEQRLVAASPKVVAGVIGILRFSEMSIPELVHEFDEAMSVPVD